LPDLSAYRLAAAECLEIARAASDKDTRARLVVLAGKFFELANLGADDHAFRVLVDEFNESQMQK
jgi:hypothetical protein